MKILIAGERGNTDNYERALGKLGVHFVTALPMACDIQEFDGLLLPGGGDIHPGFWNAPDLGSISVDAELDSLQLALFYAFWRARKPILGICKGMQIINVALGGTILQDLPDITRTQHTCPQKDLLHSTKVLPGTFLYSFYGENLITNSAHHQAIEELGDGLMPAQYGPGQVLEGFFHTALPIFGVQWHPERMTPFFEQKEDPETGDGSQVLKYFLSICSQPMADSPLL